MCSSRRDAARNAGIAGEHESVWCSGIDDRFLALNNGLELVVLLIPRRNEIPSQTIVDCEIASGLPTVLKIRPCVFISQVKTATGGLDVIARNAQQEVRKVRPRFGAAENERTVEGCVRLH